jgi:hypothetical protein
MCPSPGERAPITPYRDKIYTMDSLILLYKVTFLNTKNVVHPRPRLGLDVRFFALIVAVPSDLEELWRLPRYCV